MKIKSISLSNYKGFKELTLSLNSKSTVIFGVNGTGKTTVLSAVNRLFWNVLNRFNPSQGTAFKTLDAGCVRNGAASLEISAQVELDGECFELKKGYTKARPGKSAASFPNKKLYDKFIASFEEKYSDEKVSIPIFVNYGTNRSVLDIPLRIRNKHVFSKWTALERATENELDYRTFFEWFRNQEDYEAELIKEKCNLNYKDKSLECVRKAVETMLDGFTDLKVKRNPLRMTVTKNEAEYSVDQLSDGEKCTLAMFGDLARRMSVANSEMENPLEGDGIVLIDEIELHMHPSWQRKVLNTLKSVFPNIQFIITTHSPQILGEVDDDYNLYRFYSEDGKETVVETLTRMDGYNSNYILEQYMNTSSVNPVYSEKKSEIERLISLNCFEDAEKLIEEIKNITEKNYADVITLEGSLKRGKFLYDKNHKR